MDLWGGKHAVVISGGVTDLHSELSPSFCRDEVGSMNLLAALSFGSGQVFSVLNYGHDCYGYNGYRNSNHRK
jgi:hypothetical protein